MFGVVAPLCLLTGLLLVAQEVVTTTATVKWTKTEKLEENFCLATQCMPTCVDDKGDIVETDKVKVENSACVCNALGGLAIKKKDSTSDAVDLVDEDFVCAAPTENRRQIKNHRYKRSMAPNKSANRHTKGTYCVVAASLFLMIAFQCLTPHL